MAAAVLVYDLGAHVCGVDATWKAQDARRGAPAVLSGSVERREGGGELGRADWPASRWLLHKDAELRGNVEARVRQGREVRLLGCLVGDGMGAKHARHGVFGAAARVRDMWERSWSERRGGTAGAGAGAL